MKRNLSKNSIATFTFLSLLLGCTPLNSDALHACRTRPMMPHQQEREYPFPKSVRCLPQAPKDTMMEDSTSESDEDASSEESADQSDQANSFCSSFSDDDIADNVPYEQNINDKVGNLIRVSHLINLSTSLMAKDRFDEARGLIEKFYDDDPDLTLYFLHLLCGLNVHMTPSVLELFIPSANEVLKHLSPETHHFALSLLLEHQKVSTIDDLVEDWSGCTTSPHYTVKLDWLEALAGLTKEERAHLTQCISRLSLHSYVCGRAARYFRSIKSTDWEHATDVAVLLGANQNDGERPACLELISNLDTIRWDPLAQSFSSISPYFTTEVLPALLQQIAKLSPEREKYVVNTIKVIGQQSSILPLPDIKFMRHITAWSEPLLQSLQEDLLAFESGQADFPLILKSHIIKHTATIKERSKKTSKTPESNTGERK